MKVFICIEGDYSNAHVVGAFTKHEDAEACARLFFWEVEEYELDTIDPRSFPAGKTSYWIRINAPWQMAGTYSSTVPLRVDVGARGEVPTGVWCFTKDQAYNGTRRVWSITTWPADEKEARAIADAKILELRAAGEN